MRFLKYILIIAIQILSFTSFAQQNQDLPKGLTIAFQQGNSISLAEFFSDRIEKEIPVYASPVLVTSHRKSGILESN